MAITTGEVDDVTARVSVITAFVAVAGRRGSAVIVGTGDKSAT
jgi:hypothetical protein